MRRRKRRLIVYTVAALVVIGLVGTCFLVRSSVVSSPYYRADNVLYAFKGDGGYAFVVVMTGKKMVKVFKASEYLYDPETRSCLCGEVKYAPEFFKKVFSFNPDADFYIDLTGKNLAQFSRVVLGKDVKDLNDLIEGLMNRRSGFFDVFRVGSMAKKIRFTRIDRSALYKLIESMSNLAVDEIDIKGMTEEPLRITVGGKTILRIYLTESEKKRISEELR